MSLISLSTYWTLSLSSPLSVRGGGDWERGCIPVGWCFCSLYTHTHTHMHTCMCTHAHTHIHMHVHMYTHTCTCMHVHTCTHTHMHACMHTHTHKQQFLHLGGGGGARRGQNRKKRRDREMSNIYVYTGKSILWKKHKYWTLNHKQLMVLTHVTFRRSANSSTVRLSQFYVLCHFRD